MSLNKKYKIVFDTNLLWSSNQDKISELFNSNLKESLKFIKDNELSDRISLAIPEVVIKERISQTLNQVKIITDKIDGGLRSLNGFGINLDSKKYKINYRSIVKSIMDKILSNPKIETLKTPKVTINLILDRSLNKIKPFNDSGDKGFRDTLIWLTILNDIKTNKGVHYIFCTKNSTDFVLDELESEYKKVGEATFTIIENLIELKEFLDKNLNLKLELKKLHQSIENELKQRTGDITADFNNTMVKKSRFRGLTTANKDAAIYSTASNTWNLSLGEENEIVGYNFKSMNIQNINTIEDGLYEVSINLTVQPRFKEEGPISRVWHINSPIYGDSVRDEQDFSVQLQYSPASKILHVISAFRPRNYYGNLKLN